MRDAKLITDFTVNSKTGTKFDILGTYLTPNGRVYLKLKNTETGNFINYSIADFRVFLTNNNFEVSIESDESSNGEIFVSQINHSIDF